MTIIAIANTEKLENLPEALRKVADAAEKQIKIMGARANIIGLEFTSNKEPINIDFQVQTEELTSLSEWVDWFHK